MEPGQIVYQGKIKDGQNVVIRYPTLDDVEALTGHINTLSKEETFILLQGEQLTLDYEKEYLKSTLGKMVHKKKIVLMVFIGDRLVAESSIEMKERAESHIGRFGIAVAKDFRGLGIGKLLMKVISEEAKKEIPDLKILVLGCFSNNSSALKMYKKFGFINYGVLPNGIKHKGQYIDDICMYKFIR
jgi:RimJ/RimL family protein N-acetyltransferase